MSRSQMRAKGSIHAVNATRPIYLYTHFIYLRLYRKIRLKLHQKLKISVNTIFLWGDWTANNSLRKLFAPFSTELLEISAAIKY